MILLGVLFLSLFNAIVVSQATPILAESLVGTLTKIRGIKQIITLRGGRDPESHPRSPRPVVATWFCPAQEIAKRSRPSADVASKCTSAPSKSKPERQKSPRAASLRHQQSSSTDKAPQSNKVNTQQRSIISEKHKRKQFESCANRCHKRCRLS